MIYRFGTFEFDAENGQLRRDLRQLAIERQPARVLAILLAHAGELVSREELRQRIWGDTHVDVDRGLAYCLAHIRATLGDASDNPRFVQTFPKRGYKFIAPVGVAPPPPLISAAGEPAAAVMASGATPPPATHAARTSSRLRLVVAGALSLMLVVLGITLSRRASIPLVAVSVFDNETGVTAYDRPVAGLSDLVVSNLTNLAPGQFAVIGNADVLRRPRNLRNLKAVAESTHADYLLLGQLQQGEQGLRFVTHVIRLNDMAHLKANRLSLDSDLSGIEDAVVGEFERAVRVHLLTGLRN